MQTALIIAACGSLFLPAFVTCFALREGTEMRVDGLIAFLLAAVVWGGPLALAGYLFTLAAGLA